MNKSKRRATITGWGLVMLGGFTVLVACGSPNWQNQYTEEPVLTGGSSDDAGGGEATADDASDACASPNCNTTLSASPPSTAPPVLGDPQGNPDPVPWAVHSIIPSHRSQ